MITFVGGVFPEDVRRLAEQIAGNGGGGQPVSAGFLTGPCGVADLIEGRISLDRFAAAMETQMQDHAGALERFRSAFQQSPMAAARQLFHAVVGGEGQEVTHTSPANIEHAQVLVRLFPDARFAHALRDGREAAREIAAGGGAEKLLAALESWAKRLQVADSGVHGEEDGAEYALPEGCLEVAVLKRPGAGNRWSDGIGRLARARITRRYERTLAQLAAYGNHAAEPLMTALERES